MAFGAVSCDEFLTELPQSNITVEEDKSTGQASAFESMEDVEAAISGVYFSFNDTDYYQCELFLIGDVMSDNCYVGGDGSTDEAIDLMNLTSTNSKVNYWWANNYGIISAATNVIENIKLMTSDITAGNEARLAQIVAEAKVCRAYAMFEMVKLFGEIPLVLQILPAIDTDTIDELYPLIYPERSSVAAVYAQILSDLDETDVVALLTSQATGSSKATKGLAYGLLAKVYATMGQKETRDSPREYPTRDYSKVVEYCDKVIAEGYGMVSNFGDLWIPDNKYTSESIYELFFTTGSANWASWVLLSDSDDEIVVSWRRYCTLTHELYDKYDKADKRLAESVVWAQVPYTAFWSANNYPLAYKIRKGTSNIVLMRLADIELLKAEALVELGQSGEAMTIVNKYRDRAGITQRNANPSQEQARQWVADERQFELLFEGQRWFDLVRNDKMIEVMTAHKGLDGQPFIKHDIKPFRSLVPVPQSQRDLNENLSQNPGYGG
jgi:hypothetical protein